VTDPFPTLEVAASLGFAILLYRAVALGRSIAAGSARLPALRAGLAGDLVVLAVLLGAVLYGHVALLSAWFVGLTAGAAGLVVVTALLRLWSDRHRRATRPGRRPASQRLHLCPECGARELVAAAGALPTVEALEVCRSCGYVQGHVSDPAALLAPRD
jgi:hypothetical protein